MIQTGILLREYLNSSSRCS